MRKIILSLIWVVLAATPTLNAQQASPSQNTTTQQTSKPKARGIQASPQPRVRPTQPPAAANNNPGRNKRIANNPGHRKPAVNNPEDGNTIDNNVGRGKTTNDSRDNYAEALRRYRRERHDC